MINGGLSIILVYSLWHCYIDIVDLIMNNLNNCKCYVLLKICKKNIVRVMIETFKYIYRG